ncbi:helicase-related protein [Kitasatospora sp. NPDC048545]|uniref:helicase-related protein n=1 Tax=Kitasatospora sp. NPDC048545 TaxID=3157208 RepID=UPI0033E70A5D
MVRHQLRQRLLTGLYGSRRSNQELLRLALRIAVLRAVADLGLRRVITFHPRVSAAREFASTLLEASELLEDADRPERIWAKAVTGTDRLKDRRAAFAEFKAHTGEDGEECGILCNARLPWEGIDVRAVDAVCFADLNSSVIDIVQAIGRALRRSCRHGKVSWVALVRGTELVRRPRLAHHGDPPGIGLALGERQERRSLSRAPSQDRNRETPT